MIIKKKKYLDYMVVFNINGGLKGVEERCVFLGEGRLCWYDSGVIH